MTIDDEYTDSVIPPYLAIVRKPDGPVHRFAWGENRPDVEAWAHAILDKLASSQAAGLPPDAILTRHEALDRLGPDGRRLYYEPRDFVAPGLMPKEGETD